MGASPDPATVRGNSSLAQVLSVIAHTGAARVLLLGADMKPGRWHRGYPGQPEPDYARQVIPTFEAAGRAAHRRQHRGDQLHPRQRLALLADPNTPGGAHVITEDGTGVEEAVSYASAGHAGGYHASRGTVEAWLKVIEAGAVDSLLVEATRRIEGRYAWRGTAKTTTQGLGLPRDGLTLDGTAQARARRRRDSPPRPDALARAAAGRRPRRGQRAAAGFSVRYQLTGPEGWDTIDAMLAPVTAAPVPPGYAL